MRWFESPNFNFIGNRKITYLISGFFILIAIGTIVVKGIQYGIDFKGGKELVVVFQDDVNVVDIRSSLTEPLGASPEVKLFGSPRDILIRTDHLGEMAEVNRLVMESLAENYPDNPAMLEKTDVVGPRFANDLKYAALQAIIYAALIIFVYILVRFRNWRFSTGAVLSLMHDILVTLGVVTLLDGIVDFSLQIDQTMIAAFLTILGYSINDTVVIFDRIRENSHVHKGMEYMPMVNKSLNDTLSRTVITSFTTLFTVLVLFIFGGEVLKGFSFALIIGIAIGTYSSLCIASGIVVDLDKRFSK